MKDLKKHFKLPLNIQLFTEPNEGGNGGEGGGTDPKPKTYTEEEYKKLKDSFDKSASELAELKKRERERLTDEEKKLKEQEEKDAEYQSMKSRIEDYELKNQLIKDNTFTSEEADSIIKEKADSSKMLEVIVSLIKNKVEEAVKIAKADFMKSSDVDGSNGGSDSFAAKKAKGSKAENKPIKWGSF